MRWLRGIVAAGLLMLISTPSVGAAGPPIIFGPDHEEGDAFIYDCGDFDIVDHFAIVSTFRLFLDANGNPDRAIEDNHGTDTFANSVTGKSLTGRFSNAVNIDFQTGLGANAGVIFRFVLPGAGPVFMEIGRVISNRDGSIVTFQSGRHIDFTEGNFAAICAALA